MKIHATVRLRNAAMILGRRRMGFNQRDLSEKTGIPFWKIAEYEKLRRSPTEDDIVALALALNVNTEDLEGSLPDGVPDTLESVADIPDTALEHYAERTRLRMLELAGGIETEEAANKIERSEIIQKAISKLTHRQRQILKLRYGLRGERAHTLVEVGKKFNLSRERVRAIEAKAIRILGHPARLRHWEEKLF